MARTIREAKLETREARRRLPPQPKPHWRTLVPGKYALGFRRRQRDVPGNWVLRTYTGNPRNPYAHETLGLADDYQDADGESVLSFAQAQKLALERAGSSSRRGPLTVADAMREYISYLRAKKKTAADAEARARKHILPLLGSIRVEDLTKQQIENWLHDLAERPALRRTARGAVQQHRPSAKTDDERRARKASANRVLTTLKAALNKAYMDERVSSNRAWKLVESFEEVEVARVERLASSEATRLINAADAASGFRDLVHAALLTGCRYGELCALRVDDFAYGKLQITISKSGKKRHVVLTDEGIRFFEMLTIGRARGEPMLRNLRRMAHLSARGIEDDGEWRKSEQSRPMAEACRVAGIDPPVGFHALRHTWASLALERKVPLMVVARNLGHTDTRMVEKHYGNISDDYIVDAIRTGAPTFGAVPETNVRPLRGAEA